MNYLYPIPHQYISRVTQTFQEHEELRRKKGWTNYNGAIDWAVPRGTPITAAQTGQVADVQKQASGYGHHVRVRHADGSLTIYAHMLDFAVKKGDRVQAGQLLGRSDSTGMSTGDHLHFELRDPAGRPIDPAPLLVASLDGEPQPVEPEPVITAGDTVIVTGVGVRLRSRPVIVDETIVGHAALGGRLRVLEAAGDWVKVEAYISADWVERDV
jgi:hypothetical protein